MWSLKITRRLLILVTVLLFIFSSLAFAQDKRKGKRTVPRGRPVLWKNPGNIRSRDLFLGPGGAEMQPDTSSIRFLKEDKGGYSVKFRVKDGRGREWAAK